MSVCPAYDACMGYVLQVYGARPIKRWMKKNVTRVLVDMLVNGEACKGTTISIDASDDKRGLKYRVLKKQEMADPLGLLQVML